MIHISVALIITEGINKMWRASVVCILSELMRFSLIKGKDCSFNLGKVVCIIQGLMEDKSP